MFLDKKKHWRICVEQRDRCLCYDGGLETSDCVVSSQVLVLLPPCAVRAGGVGASRQIQTPAGQRATGRADGRTQRKQLQPERQGHMSERHVLGAARDTDTKGRPQGAGAETSLSSPTRNQTLERTEEKHEWTSSSRTTAITRDGLSSSDV